MMFQSVSSPKALVQSPTSVFFGKPDTLNIDEESKTRYATSQKIETLIEELKENGPLIALGNLGPSAYEGIPFKLKNKEFDQDIYGFKPGTHKEYSPQNCLMVLGAKKEEGSEYVYYTMTQDITPNSESYTRTHTPSQTDSKVYKTSHKTFRNYLFDMYPPVQKPQEPTVFVFSSRLKNCLDLSPSEKEYVEKLSAITPLDSILDRSEGEAKCKALGQEIFDKYKTEAGGNSMAGKEAAQKICNAVVFMADDGALRKQYIERAWDGIGDDVWDWRA